MIDNNEKILEEFKRGHRVIVNDKQNSLNAEVILTISSFYSFILVVGVVLTKLATLQRSIILL
jgi:hypothetical protein